MKFPDRRAQRIPPAQPHGSNAQDILAITRDALERARVSFFLQPIISLPTRRVEFYEAYSRIQDHDGNYIGPHQYLELAERAGLVGAIDNNLLFRCIQLLRRVRRHNRDYGFSAMFRRIRCATTRSSASSSNSCRITSNWRTI